MSQVYDIHGLVQFHVRRGSPGRRLRRLLKSFETNAPLSEPIELFLHAFPSSLRTLDHSVAGKYKGIPWRMTWEFGPHGLPRSVHFAAPAFMSFLLLRMVIIPCLHRVLVGGGGFYIPGSAFAVGEKTVVLFGPPGVGKTHCALRMVAKETRLIADGALLIAPSGQVRGLLHELEIRYATVRDTGLWRALPLGTRGMLRLYHAISWATCRRISFNVEIVPETFSCRMENDAPNRQHVFMAVSRNGKIVPLEPQNFAERILAFYDWYEARFQTIVPMIASNERALIGENIGRVLGQAAAWEVPVDIGPKGVSEVLSRS